MKSVALLISLAAVSSAGIVQDVRGAIARGDLAAGDAALASYRKAYGVTPEMLAAQSWLGRAALAAKQYAAAGEYAKKTLTSAAPLLKQRPLDAEPNLPIAVGAAIEVQGQALAALGRRAEAVEFLTGEFETYRKTSIAVRIQKNIHVLSLEGKVAPPLKIADYLGPKPAALSSLRGKAVILFFWAHWCGDCKAQAPILAQLEREFAGKLQVVAPTQYYGYVARGEEAPRNVERAYIDQTRLSVYSDIAKAPAPLSEENFQLWGVSTTPTLVLLDSKGIVRLYHPGRMTYEELRAAIAKVLPS